MTGNLFLDLLISAGGVAAMVALSFAFGGLKTVKVDLVSARERLSFDEPDFLPVRWIVDSNGRAAAAIDEKRREAAFVFAVGDGLATRRMPLASVRVFAEGAAITALLGDLSRRKLTIAVEDAATAREWAAMLGAKP